MGEPDTHGAVVCLGELSEQLKSEVEQNICQVKQQEQELHLLRRELLEMSMVMKEKDRALQAAANELRYMQP